MVVNLVIVFKPLNSISDVSNAPVLILIVSAMKFSKVPPLDRNWCALTPATFSHLIRFKTNQF